MGRVYAFDEVESGYSAEFLANGWCAVAADLGGSVRQRRLRPNSGRIGEPSRMTALGRILPLSQSARRFQHQPFHLRHGFLPPYKQGLRDNRVADVEFVDARQRGDGLHVVIGQAMPGIHR